MRTNNGFPKTMLLLAALLIVLPAMVSATTLTVSQDGSAAYTRIQDAVDAAATGDGSDFDMGVYEFGPYPSAIKGYILDRFPVTPSQKVMLDLTGDSKTDISDFITSLNNQVETNVSKARALREVLEKYGPD